MRCLPISSFSIISITDTIISITALVSLIITLLKYRRLTEKEFQDRVQKIARDEILNFVDSEQFKKNIVDIINDSKLYERIEIIDTKLTEMLTILCYTDDKLKNTPVCSKINNIK